jgi:hypothetical protein
MSKAIRALTLLNLPAKDARDKSPVSPRRRMNHVIEGELVFVGRGNPAPSKYYIVSSNASLIHRSVKPRSHYYFNYFVPINLFSRFPKTLTLLNLQEHLLPIRTFLSLR